MENLPGANLSKESGARLVRDFDLFLVNDYNKCDFRDMPHGDSYCYAS